MVQRNSSEGWERFWRILGVYRRIESQQILFETMVGERKNGFVIEEQEIVSRCINSRLGPF